MRQEPIKLLGLSRVAWRNLGRNPLRAGLLILSIAVTAAILFGTYYFMNSINRSLDAGGARMGADLIVTPAGTETSVENLILSGVPTKIHMPASVAEQVATVPGVERISPQMYLTTFVGECCNVTGEFPIIAIDPQQDFTVRQFFMKDMELKPGEVIIGNQIGSWDAYGMYYLKDWTESVRLLRKDFRIHNMLHRTNLGMDKSIYMTLEDARSLAKNEPRLGIDPNEISVVMVKLQPGANYEAVAKAIEEKIPGVKAFTGNKLSSFVESQLAPIKYLIFAIIGLVIFMAILQVMAIFSAIVHERRREIGYLRAMGATKGKVVRLFLWEGLWAALLGGGTGILLMLILLVDMRHVIQNMFPLPLVFPWFRDGALVSLGAMLAAILITLGAASIPVWRTLKLDPYEAIREGE